MLMVSEDGKRLMCDEHHAVAEWGEGRLYFTYSVPGSWDQGDAIIIAQFIEAGPPKQWRRCEMLKVSGSGRELDKFNGTYVENVATWLDDGTLYLREGKIYTREDCDGLADFITCGPPKQWRITRTFGKKPCVVSTDGDPTFVYSLCDSDIEEV